eukprot:7064858-Prymnesium_polylepis.2
MAPRGWASCQSVASSHGERSYDGPHSMVVHCMPTAVGGTHSSLCASAKALGVLLPHTPHGGRSASTLTHTAHGRAGLATNKHGMLDCGRVYNKYEIGSAGTVVMCVLPQLSVQ